MSNEGSTDTTSTGVAAESKLTCSAVTTEGKGSAECEFGGCCWRMADGGETIRLDDEEPFIASDVEAGFGTEYSEEEKELAEANDEDEASLELGFLWCGARLRFDDGVRWGASAEGLNGWTRASISVGPSSTCKI